MATILVTGVGGPAGKSVAGMLLERGHTVVGTDMRQISLPGVLCYTVPAAGDPGFISELRWIAEAHEVALLIPTVSEELPVLAAGRTLLTGIALAVAELGPVSLANDKYLTCLRLAMESVPVPRYALPSEGHSPQELAGLVGWPCLSKPRVGRGGRNVALYYPNEPAALLALDDRVILQEFAPGAEYAPNVYLGRGRHSVAVVLEKLALRGGQVGNALAVRRVDDPDIGALAVAAGRALGLSGPIDVDIRRRADGTPVVLEVNARFGANSAAAPEVLDALLAEQLLGQARAVAGAEEWRPAPGE
jgi:carbamoylphosphate synthase large subunit